MNGWDILLILLIAGAVVLAVRHMVRNRNRSCCGGADCASCRQRCEWDMNEIRTMRESGGIKHDRD